MRRLNLFLGIIMIIPLAFTVSCVSKEVPVTETYSETEYRTETYTTTENVAVNIKGGTLDLTPVTEWQAPIYFKIGGSGVQNTFYKGYQIESSNSPHSNITIQVSRAAGKIGVYDLTGIGQISSMPALAFVPSWTDPATGEIRYGGSVGAWLDSLNNLASDSQRTLYAQSIGIQSEITFDANGIKEFAIIANTLAKSTIKSVKLTWPDQSVEEREVTRTRPVPYEVEKQRTVMQTKMVPFWEVWKAEPAAETQSSAPVPPAEESSPPLSPPITPEVKPPVTSPRLLSEDDFSNPNSGWGTSSANWGKFAYEEGEYSISIEGTNYYGYHLNSVSGKLENFTVEVDVRKLSTGIDDVAGIIFRDQIKQGKDSFYVFWVDSNSETYAIQKYIKDVWTPDLKAFTPSGYINGGANTNRLKVICQGSQIEVYANDNKLTTIIDTSLTSGFIGLAADTFTSSDAHYHFDNFKLYTDD